MLRGSKVGLRARHEDDIPVLQADLYDDPVTHSRAQGSPWQPTMPGSKYSAVTVDDGAVSMAAFSVVDLGTEALVGTASLWGIDTHSRSAHLGVGILSSARGKGYGTDTVAVLCHYGFVVRGLHRLQIETLADNTAVLAMAENNGFVREGVMRSSAWVLGEFLDEALYGLLAEEWKPALPHS
ncbi:GNAT family N-acetyltransferase [Nocardiopsis valliformis]|uniref:GNAT family N-acetyltransferase n=1 Tax=Nocardiopsis valliformis TaxID=239974 RepID=UPI000347E7D1|nr:GNAT family protein [Nocardiopsis valliformis]